MGNIHHRALKVAYNRKKSYEEFVVFENEVSVCQGHLHAHMMEVFSSLDNINLEFKQATSMLRMHPC